VQPSRLNLRILVVLVLAASTMLACATTGSAAPPPPPPSPATDAPAATTSEGTIPDRGHRARSVITPSQVPIGETPMGAQSATGTNGASPTVPEMGKGTVGSGAQP
jgi:hypothetical protein